MSRIERAIEPPTAFSVINRIAPNLTAREAHELAEKFGPTELQYGLSPKEIERALKPLRPIFAEARLPQYMGIFIRRELTKAYRKKYPQPTF